MKRPTNDFWKQIALLDENLSSVTYYEILGLESGADSESIRKSYERQVRVVHPDRHARESDASRKQCLTRVYARIGEAFRVLSQPGLRSEYDGGLVSGKLRHRQSRADTHRGAISDPKHPQAKSLFEQAQAMIARNDIRAAKAKLQFALQYQPDSQAINDAIEMCDAARVPTPSPPPDPLPPESVPLATPTPAVEPAERSVTVALPDEAFVSSAPGSGPQSRKHTRVPLGRSIEVSCEAWQHVTNLFMQNISRGGMLLRCDEVLELGAVLELALKAPDGAKIELPAEVVRHIAPQSEGGRPAMGIRFLLIPEPERESFELLLRAAGIRPSPEESLDLPVIEDSMSPEDDDVALLIDKAKKLIDSGDAREAIPFLQIAVRNHPTNGPLRAAFHLAAGLTSRAMGLSAPARLHFARALRCDPDSSLVLRHLRDDDT